MDGLRLLVALGLMLVVAAPAAARPYPAPIPARNAIPLGAAVFYGCADATFADLPPLACSYAPPAGTTRAAQADAYAAALAGSFDRLTPENEFKMVWTEPQQGRFDFRAADGLAALAQRDGMKVRGHTLVYAGSSPGWVTDPQTPWTRERLLAAVANHITTEMRHFGTAYPGVVDEWDVVNEPFLDDGTRSPNVFERVVGPDWIEQAFRTAAAVDPDTLLYLNEFDADTDGPRQRAVLALVRDFVARGVPIDGIGLQMHLGADGRYPTRAQLQAVMAQYAELGLRVAITELDVLRPAADDGGVAQRAAYGAAAEACRQATNCTSTTVWGVADRFSWRGPDQQADLLDAAFARKPAYADVRCRLADPRPATGPWTPAACGGDAAAPGSPGAPAVAAPLVPGTPAPAPAAPAAAVPAASAAPTVPTPAARASTPRASALLRLRRARRSARAITVSGTTRASDGVVVGFRQRVRGRTLRISVLAPVRGGRFAATLRPHGALARVSRGTLEVRFAGSARLRPATERRTLRLP